MLPSPDSKEQVTGQNTIHMVQSNTTNQLSSGGESLLQKPFCRLYNNSLALCMPTFKTQLSNFIGTKKSSKPPHTAVGSSIIPGQWQ